MRILPALRKYWFPASIVAVFGLGGLYWAFEGGDAIDALEKSLLRNFVTCPATSHLWFYVFPDRFEYRGILNSIHMVPSSVSRDALTIEDVANRATGAEFCSNTSLVGIGWSGGGPAGVLLAAGCYFLIAVTVDLLVRPMPTKMQLGVVALAASLFVQLACGSLSDFVLAGGLVAVVGAGCVYRWSAVGVTEYANRNRSAFYSAR